MTTLTSLIAVYNTLASANGLPNRKGFDSKAKAEAAIKMLTPKKTGTSVKVRKAGAVHVKGPQGFKFGPVWMQSIADGKGIALSAKNLPKLLDTVTFLGIDITPDLTQAEIASAIAKVQLN